MKFLVTADWHYDQYHNISKLQSNLLTRQCEWVDRAVNEILIYAKNHEIAHVIVAGDIFHKRDAIEIPVFNRVWETLEKSGVELYLLVGNHDQTTKGGVTNSIHSFSTIATVISHPMLIPIGGYDFYFLPYEEGDQSVESLNALLAENYARSAAPSVLIGHLGLSGARYSGFERLSKEAVNLNDLHPEKFKGCFFGHFHVSQQLGGNAWYVGAPMQHSFRDRDQERGFFEVELTYEDREWIVRVQFVPITNTPKFKYLTLEQYLAGEYGAEDFVKLINVDSSILQDVEITDNLVGVEDQSNQLVIPTGLSILDDLDSLVEQWVKANSINPRRDKALKTLGKEIVRGL